MGTFVKFSLTRVFIQCRALDCVDGNVQQSLPSLSRFPSIMFDCKMFGFVYTRKQNCDGERNTPFLYEVVVCGVVSQLLQFLWRVEMSYYTNNFRKNSRFNEKEDNNNM